MNNNRWGKPSTTQHYYHYSFWEDVRNGILDKRCESEKIEEAKVILGKPNKFLQLGRKMIRQWPQCTRQYLTDKSMNRRAYIGASVCNFAKGCTEREVRLAWWELNEKQRKDANLIADILLEEFECLRRV